MKNPKMWWAGVAVASLIQLGMRWWVASGLSHRNDDVRVIYDALGSSLSPGYIFSKYSGHLEPLPSLIAWITVRAAPFDAGFAFFVVILLLLVTDFVILLMLRRLFGAGPLTLVLYVAWLFTPMMSSTLTSWSLAFGMIPMVATMAWATREYVAYMNAPPERFLISRRFRAGLALVLLLLASTFGVLLVAFLALLTVAYPNLGGSQSLKTVWRRAKPLWLRTFLPIMLVYLILYSFIPDSNTRSPHPISLLKVWWALSDFAVQTVIPSFVGGPWTLTEVLEVWAAMPPLAVLVVLEIVGILAVVSVLMRPLAWRAWVVFLAIFTPYVVAMAVAQPDWGDGAIFRQSRFAIPLVVPMLVTVGAAFSFGPKRAWVSEINQSPERVIRALAPATAAIVFIALINSMFVGNVNQAQQSRAASTKNFWSNAEQGLARTRGQAVQDRYMPDNVLFGPFFRNLALASQSLEYFSGDIRWNAPADQQHMILDDGRVVPATVSPFAASVPGTIPECGYLVRSDAPVTIPMDRSQFSWGWAVQMNYLASEDATLQVRGGETTQSVSVVRGLGEITLINAGIIDEISIAIEEPSSASVCVDYIVLGGLVPETDDQD